MVLSAHYRDRCQEACSYLHICEGNQTRKIMATIEIVAIKGFRIFIFVPGKLVYKPL